MDEVHSPADRTVEEILPHSLMALKAPYKPSNCVKKIFSYNKEQIQIKETNLPISRTYKKSVLDALNNHFQG